MGRSAVAQRIGLRASGVGDTGAVELDAAGRALMGRARIDAARRAPTRKIKTAWRRGDAVRRLVVLLGGERLFGDISKKI